MTLEQWREAEGLEWKCVSHKLDIYYHHLWRLRSGKVEPTEEEIKQLLLITNNEVDSFR